MPISDTSPPCPISDTPPPPVRYTPVSDTPPSGKQVPPLSFCFCVLWVGRWVGGWGGGRVGGWLDGRTTAGGMAGDLIDCTKMGIGGKAIPPHIDRVENIKVGWGQGGLGGWVRVWRVGGHVGGLEGLERVCAR